VGLTAAIELARRGIDCRIIDSLFEPPLYAKAVGVQPRTLEVFEGMGVLRRVLDAAIPMYGQILYLNGDKLGQLDFTVPDDIPFGFIAIPQYVAERILRDELASLRVPIQRGVRLTGFEQDTDGVTSTLVGDDGETTMRTSYLVGADGAHSIVRKTLGLTFEGGAFEEQYMLGDVEVDWSQPDGYAVRMIRQVDDRPDDILVCIPLPAEPDPGRGTRYRMSMLVPDELSSTAVRSSDGVAHGFAAGPQPELRHIQAVLDRLSPEPTTARNLRWSSVFRISHRIVDAYGRGRAFVAGDAAHIHPPTGAQGMNTGIQDAHNLAWKLALAVRGEAADGLLDTYDAERRPVGEEVVGRTVRSAREGIGADLDDPHHVIRREAQLLISYADSPIVGGLRASEIVVGPGDRAPDARGLTRAAVSEPIRLFALLSRRDHTCLFYADGATTAQSVPELEAAAVAAVEAALGRLDVYLIADPEADVASTALPLIRDTAGEFAAAYSAAGRSVYVLRPDGYLGFAAGAPDPEALVAHLRLTFKTA
jgi:2-polyprenyl-6-methoxyphenol hydroxylase-like FAD-dependent oxidoreductase